MILKKEKHNLRRNSIYSVWSGIKDRCYNKNSPAYKNYGGRGIDMYRDWRLHFMSFYDWAIENGYKKGLTIERINNDWGYSPNNCRWATMKEQSRNRRTNRIINYNGYSFCVSEWAEKLGISSGAIFGRLKRGYSVEKALFHKKTINSNK